MSGVLLRGYSLARMTEVWPGQPFPLGATWDGEGTNFSIFTENGEGAELCLYDDAGSETRIEMTQRTALNYHCYVPGVGPGQRYGFRVRGRYAPAEGHRFNPAKLLIDPYAKAIDGHGRLVGRGSTSFPTCRPARTTPTSSPTTRTMMRRFPSRWSIDAGFDWEGDRPPRIAWADTVIYETHVKGFTKLPPRRARGSARNLRRARLRAGDRAI